MATNADFDRLYSRHHETLMTFFVRRVADVEVAADLWAETLAQVYVGISRCRASDPDGQAAWLFGIAHKQLDSYYRRGYARTRALNRMKLERPVVTTEVAADVVAHSGLDDVRADLAQALATLPPQYREAVQLRVVHELSYPELADRLSISEQAARARVSRGLRSLGDLLDRTAMTEALQT